MAEDASALADAILARLDSLDAASVSLWPRWKEVAGTPQARPPASRRPMSAVDANVANRRANRPRSAVASDAGPSSERQRKKTAKSRKPAPRRRRRRTHAAPASDLDPSPPAAPESTAAFPESFASAVDQLRARVGQLSSHLDHAASARPGPAAVQGKVASGRSERANGAPTSKKC